jgi:hypothetical protein
MPTPRSFLAHVRYHIRESALFMQNHGATRGHTGPLSHAAPLTGISRNWHCPCRPGDPAAVIQCSTLARIRRWRELIQRSANALRHGIVIARPSSYPRIAEHNCPLELALDARRECQEDSCKSLCTPNPGSRTSFNVPAFGGERPEY